MYKLKHQGIKEFERLKYEITTTIEIGFWFLIVYILMMMLLFG